MVYRGPSKGCAQCRKRRVKCDEKRPQCSNCIKRRLHCPGYEDIFDNLHRSHNELVLLKTPHRKHIVEPDTSLLLTTQSETLVEDEDASRRAAEVQHEAQSRLVVGFLRMEPSSFACHLPAVVCPDLQTAALDFFFVNYGIPFSHHHQVSDGFMSHLQSVVGSAPSHSPLHMAVSAVAINITMLWSRRGHDTILARSCYAKAVQELKKAIFDPAESMNDTTLMTALVLDFYDAVNAHFSTAVTNGSAHKYGALALIKHRGQSNFKDQATVSMLLSARSSMIHHAMSHRAPMPAESETIFQNPELHATPAGQADVLGARLATHLAKVKTASAIVSSADRQSALTDLLRSGLELDVDFFNWTEAVSERWRPHVLVGDDVPATIRGAGVYQNRCSVYRDLSIAEIFNDWRSRRIMLLHSLQQSYYAVFGLHDSQVTDFFERTSRQIQELADELCDSVPFFLGDCTENTSPLYWHKIIYPSSSDGLSTFPADINRHAGLATTTGGWFMLTPLLTLSNLTRPTDGAMPVVLRDGQQEWIRGQLLRLQDVFTFADPLWKKADLII